MLQVREGCTRECRGPQGIRASYSSTVSLAHDWIAIPVPSIITDDTFQAASRVSRDNSKWSPRHVGTDEAWLLRALVRYDACGQGVSRRKMRGRDGTMHPYYYCRNQDPLRAGSEDRRCRERNIRSDALDACVFNQVREVLPRPDVPLAGKSAPTARAPAPDDQLLAKQLAASRAEQTPPKQSGDESSTSTKPE